MHNEEINFDANYIYCEDSWVLILLILTSNQSLAKYHIRTRMIRIENIEIIVLVYDFNEIFAELLCDFRHKHPTAIGYPLSFISTLQLKPEGVIGCPSVCQSIWLSVRLSSRPLSFQTFFVVLCGIDFKVSKCLHLQAMLIN